MTKALEKIFSVKNDKDKKHKVVNVCGLKMKFKKKVEQSKLSLNQVKPTLPYLEVHLCDHCNLNCKGCGHQCPDVDGEVFTDVEQFTNDINELSKKIFIKKIRLMGGEPLLHPQVNRFMFETRKAFPRADIRLVTNGILLPTMEESFWKTCRDNNIIIDMSKYPIVGNKFAEYLDLLDDNDVKLGIIHLSKKFFTKRNDKGDSNIKEAFNACSSKYCVNLWKSKLYTCPACFRYYSNKRHKENRELPVGLDIYKVTGEEIKNKMNKPISACRYCLVDPIYFPWEKGDN